MGVKNLWRLLLPIGHRISIETLAGSTLAVDASIWMTQFLKVMRDPETGAVRAEAHLVGFLRRLCKLLFWQIRPVLVFDGPTPELKRRELAKRRHRRDRLLHAGLNDDDDDNAEGNNSNVKRMARRILLQELRRQKNGTAKEKGSNKKTNSAFVAGFSLPESDANSEKDSKKKNDTSEAETTNGDQVNPQQQQGADIETCNDDITESLGTKSDPHVLLEGEDTIDYNILQNNQEEEVNDWDMSPNDKKGDESEEGANFEWREVEDDFKTIDPDAWVSMPDNVKKEVIEGARRKQRMRSRKEFMPVAAQPEDFSQVQLQNFLRSSNLNKQIQGLSKTAATTSSSISNPFLQGERIASDASRRIIFTKDTDEIQKKNDTNPRNPYTYGRVVHNSVTKKSSPDKERSETSSMHNPSPPHHRLQRRQLNIPETENDDAEILLSMEEVVETSGKTKHDVMVHLFGDDDDSSDDDDVDIATQKPSSAAVDSSNSIDLESQVDSNSDDEHDYNNDDDAEGGGGFLTASSAVKKQYFNHEGLLTCCSEADNRRHAQMLEDEQLARAIQMAQDDELVASDNSSNNEIAQQASSGGLVAVTRLTSAAAPGLQSVSPMTHGTQSPKRQAIFSDQGRSTGVGEVIFDLTKNISFPPSTSQNKSEISDIHTASVLNQINIDSDEQALDDDDSDEVNWEDGNDSTCGVATRTGETLSQEEIKIVDITSASDSDDTSEEEVDWEDGGEASVPNNDSEEISKPTQDDSITISDQAIVSPSNQSSFEPKNKQFNHPSEELMQQKEAGNESDSVVSEKKETNYQVYDSSSDDAEDALDQASGFDRALSDANAAALEHAQSTASQLTNWAGRAFRRAMAAHAAESDEIETSFIPTNAQETKIDKNTKSTLDNTSSIIIPIPASNTLTIHDDNINESPTENTDADESSKQQPDQEAVFTMSNQSLANLAEEENTLRENMNRNQRDMDTVTDEMKEEIIQLLQLFGIPYLEAPAEAEAQCVALEDLGLVDGIVTEDSDVFVFGGKNVYRNIFDDQKYVEVYKSADAKRDLALDRNHMVALAMLLGGDYTDGVKGVGIVNGMEILQAFDVSNDVKEGLGNFRHWLDGFNPADAIGGSTSVSKSLPSQEAVFHEKHRLARTRWVAPSDFPSQRVLEAYLKPVVDKSNARFSWGIPDLDGLRSFCSSKIGWEPGETDRIVIPVIKKMEDPSRQTRIESYFMNYDDKIKFAHVRSKRLRDVIQNIQQPPQQKVSEVSGDSQNLAPNSQESNNLVDHTITSESRGSSKKKSKSRKETRKRKAK